MTTNFDEKIDMTKHDNVYAETAEKDETVLDIVDEYLKMELPQAPDTDGTD